MGGRATGDLPTVTDGAPPIGWSGVTGALATQCRVIRALILRETKSRYGEHKLGFLWALIEPTLMVILFVAFFALTRSSSVSNMAVVPFMITGIVPFSLFKDTMSQMQGAVTSNKALLGFPQVTTFDVVLARGILDTAVILCVLAIMLALAQLFGFEWRCEDPLGVLAVCGLLALTGMGFGFLFASIIPVVPSMRQVTSLVFGRPLFLSSGLFFTAESLPPPVREWLLWNPLLHMMELMRDRFFVEFVTGHGSWSYAGSFAVTTFVVGLLVHQAMRKRAVIGL